MNTLVMLLFFSVALNQRPASTDSLGGLEEVPTVSYCDLITNPQAYSGKMVRIKASYFSGRHTGFFYDLDCDGVTKRTHAVLSCNDEEFCKKLVGIIDGALISGRAELTVVGKFKGLGGYGKLSPSAEGFRFELEFNKIEKASGIPASVPWPE